MSKLRKKFAFCVRRRRPPRARPCGACTFGGGSAPSAPTPRAMVGFRLSWLSPTRRSSQSGSADVGDATRSADVGGATLSPSPPISPGAAAVRLQAAARGRRQRHPISVGGSEYYYEGMLGPSYAWGRKRGYVIKARNSASGYHVAIKVLRNTEYARQALALEEEVRLCEAVREAYEAVGCPGGCEMPAIIAHDPRTVVMELVGDGAVTLQSWLRRSRQLDFSEAEAGVALSPQAELDARVCWIAVKKVALLLHAVRPIQFSHRDLHDGNLMIRLREPVRCLADVDVYVLDFGKAMARIGEGNGMVVAHDYNNNVFNPTADTLRLCWSLQRSLLIAHGFTKTDGWRGQGAAGGALMYALPTLAVDEGVLDMFRRMLPFADRVEGWLHHVRTLLLEESSAQKSATRFTTRGSQWNTLIDFCCAGMEAQNKLLHPYYQMADENAWYTPLLPQSLSARQDTNFTSTTPGLPAMRRVGTAAHRSAPPCTAAHRSAPPCTAAHRRAPPRTAVHRRALPRTAR